MTKLELNEALLKIHDQYQEAFERRENAIENRDRICNQYSKLNALYDQAMAEIRKEEKALSECAFLSNEISKTITLLEIEAEKGKQ